MLLLMSLGAFIIACLLGGMVTAAAQEPMVDVGNAHARAKRGADTLLTVANASLLVPAGAVAPGVMIGFGVGGVPSLAGAPGVTGLIITAATNQQTAMTVVILLRPADRQMLDGRAPALVDTARRRSEGCLARQEWIACPVRRPGAYVLDAWLGAPPADMLLDHALDVIAAQVAQEPPTLVVIVSIMVVAAVGGGLLALLGGHVWQDPG